MRMRADNKDLKGMHDEIQVESPSNEKGSCEINSKSNGSCNSSLTREEESTREISDEQ